MLTGYVSNDCNSGAYGNQKSAYCCKHKMTSFHNVINEIILNNEEKVTESAHPESAVATATESAVAMGAF